MTPEIASDYAETMERWIAAVEHTSSIRHRETSTAVPRLPGTFTLHIATPSGDETVVDITDAVNRASFTRQAPDGTSAFISVSEALPGDPGPRLVHRIMLVTCHNQDGSSDIPTTVDPEAERCLAVHARQQGDDT